MRSILVIAVLLFSGLYAEAKDVYVRGYTKSNGTYVEPHHRTAPDNTTSNNYSTQGNTNPYTGKAGTVSPTDTYKPGNWNTDSED